MLLVYTHSHTSTIFIFIYVEVATGGQAHFEQACFERAMYFCEQAVHCAFYITSHTWITGELTEDRSEGKDGDPLIFYSEGFRLQQSEKKFTLTLYDKHRSYRYHHGIVLIYKTDNMRKREAVYYSLCQMFHLIFTSSESRYIIWIHGPLHLHLV